MSPRRIRACSPTSVGSTKSARESARNAILGADFEGVRGRRKLTRTSGPAAVPDGPSDTLGGHGATPTGPRTSWRNPMRGIISAGAYVPYWRLQRSAIGQAMGTYGGSGTRAVASYDEDTTTMGVEAGRLALRPLGAPGSVAVDQLLFATAEPAYLEKTNATAIHAALRLDSDCLAIDVGGAARSGVGALRVALAGSGTTLVVVSDLRNGLPTGADESQGGDGAAALVVGDESNGTLIAEHLGGASATHEFLDRWRLPGDARTKQWEERFGELQYLPLAEQAWNAALKAADVSADQVTKVVVTGVHA